MGREKNKKIGRPTVADKDLFFKCRIDDGTLQMILRCSAAMQKNKSEVVRLAVARLYETILPPSGEPL